MASRIWNRRQALERECKDMHLKMTVGSQIAASATLDLTNDIALTSVATGAARNTNTFTLQVAAAAANPTNTILAGFTGTAAAIVCTITPNDGTNNPANVAATAVLDLTNDITLTSAAAGTGRNTNTLTLQVAAAAANPTDTILADFTGTAAAIVCTITPNDGTNNGATPVNLTTAELVELINTGAVVGKTVTVTDASSLRNDQTATGGGAQNLADSGEGDGVVATFSGGTTVAVNITTAQVRELITTGAVVGKSVTITDGSSLRALQTATGGGAANVADSGEGDGVVATFSGGGANQPSIDSGAGVGITSVVRNGVGDYTITLDQTWSSLKRFDAIVFSSTAIDAMFQVYSESVTSKSVRFLVLQGASAYELPNSTKILVKLELKNTNTF